jgi:hypothetical protein
MADWYRLVCYFLKWSGEMKKVLSAVALVLASSAALAGNTQVSNSGYTSAPGTPESSNSSFFTTLAAGTYTFAFNLDVVNKTTLDAVWLSTSGDKYTTGVDDFHVFSVTPGSTAATGSWTQTFASATKVFFNVNGTKNKNLGYNVAYSITPVPEPETYAMFLAGLGALGLLARRRKTL